MARLSIIFNEVDSSFLVDICDSFLIKLIFKSIIIIYPNGATGYQDLSFLFYPKC